MAGSRETEGEAVVLLVGVDVLPKVILAAEVSSYAARIIISLGDRYANCSRIYRLVSGARYKVSAVKERRPFRCRD